jgi:hypothetical protein
VLKHSSVVRLLSVLEPHLMFLEDAVVRVNLAFVLGSIAGRV